MKGKIYLCLLRFLFCDCETNIILIYNPQQPDNCFMKRYILTIIIALTLHYISVAQTASVKGMVRDTTNKENLTNTVVSLLRQKDSVLYKFKRSDAKGNFSITDIKAGKYLLFVTHPTYADYADKVQIDSGVAVDLGTIKMTLYQHLLEEVIVKQKISAIRVNGDTTEFKSDSFKVREGANVEEMLKKLPGIQVDKDGKITAMGEQIKKVYVDGEEFFGDDPTIATRNLQASDVDKVQVYDKKSDQSTFTGIDDGTHEKAINLKIKADKKNGYFGKLELSGDGQERWNNSLMLNSFRARRKLSAYGIISSTGKTGLDWDERGKYGSSDNASEYNEDNGYFMSEGSDNELTNSSYYGEGLPKTWGGGINYSDKFNDEKQSLNGSYTFTKLNTAGAGSNLSQLITGNNVFTTQEAGNTFSSRLRHYAGGTFDWAFDSSISLKIKANGYYGKTNSLTNIVSQTANTLGIATNSSDRNTTSLGDNNNLLASALLRKKFAKKGRTFSLNLEQQQNASNTDGYLLADIGKLDGSGGLTHTITDQNKKMESRTSSINTRLIYTEPLSTKVFMELNYSIRNSDNDAERLTYNRSTGGKYEMLNDTFSNHYRFNVLTNSAGLGFKYNGKKVTLNLGSNVALANFKQTDMFTDVVTKRDFTNFFPKASFNYKFNQASRFNIMYNGSTQQPTINQIQPVQDNSNPLSITIGNPNLKQQFNHKFNMNFNSFKVITQRGFFLYSGFTLQQNAIVNNSTINDTSGKTVYQYINANGNYNYYSGLNYWIKLKKIDANLNLEFNMNGSRFNSFVNNIKNTTVTTNPGGGISFSKDKEKKYNFYVRYNINYNLNTTIVTNTVQTNYWIMNPTFGFNYQLPKRLEINIDGDFTVRQKTDLFSGKNNVFMINAYIGRKIFKNDKGIIKFIAHDIFNQNIGYSRYVTANMLSERNYQTITRYFLLSFLWNFTKKAPTAAGDATISK